MIVSDPGFFVDDVVERKLFFNSLNRVGTDGQISLGKYLVVVGWLEFDVVSLAKIGAGDMGGFLEYVFEKLHVHSYLAISALNQSTEGMGEGSMPYKMGK